MAAALLAVPTVLTLPADGRPDLALKPRLLGEHEAATPGEQAAGSRALPLPSRRATGVPEGFTSTETCKEECYTYAGGWTEKSSVALTQTLARPVNSDGGVL